MRSAFHQQQEACLGKGALRAVLIETRAEGFSIAGRVSHRLDRPIDGKQAHPFPEGARSLGRSFGSGRAPKEFLQQFAAQLGASVDSRPT
jgi:fido (protein-threonine AMPylation protein)